MNFLTSIFSFLHIHSFLLFSTFFLEKEGFKYDKDLLNDHI